MEEDEPIAKVEAEIDIFQGFSSLENKIVKPRKKKDRLEVKEFASIQYQGKNLKMMGEAAPYWRPKTRPKNKLILNMKRLLNPKLNINEVTILDDVSPDEKPEVDKVSRKGKKQIVAKT